MDIFAGLAKLKTQINKLEKRIHMLDMNDVDVKELHTAIESLNALKSRYKEMQEEHTKKKESREKALAEIPVESATLMPTPPLPELPKHTKDPLPPMQEPMYGETKKSELKCPNCGSTNVTPAFGHKLNKCDSCHMAFDNESSANYKEPEEKEAAPLSAKPESVDADEIAESFVNGNISWVREQIGDSLRMFNEVLMSLETMHPESISSFRRLMTQGSSDKPSRLPTRLPKGREEGTDNSHYHGIGSESPESPEYLEGVEEKLDEPTHVKFPHLPPRPDKHHHIVDVPVPEPEPQEKKSDVMKYAIHDVVEPARGTPGSKGRVMGHDEANDMVYVAWDQGKLKDDHGYGAYSSKDLKKSASQKQANHSCSVEGCTGKADDVVDGKWYCYKHLWGKKKKEAASEFGFDPKDENIPCKECGRTDLPLHTDYKCPNCSKYQQETKTADVEVEAPSNSQVIDMFISDSFPKDKMSNWGSANLKINKEDHGWSLINYSTPIMYRDNDGTLYFNTQKYSVTTSKLQSYMRQQAGDAKQVDQAGIMQAIKGTSNTEVSPSPESGGGGYSGDNPISVAPKGDEAVPLKSDLETDEVSENESWMPDEPTEEDIFISDDRGQTHAWYLGKPIASLENDDWDAFFGQIADWMASNNYSPTVWSVSDHGNVDVDNSFYEFAKTRDLEREKVPLDTVSSLDKSATVTKHKDGWHVMSEEGKNLGGPYKSKEEAVKRLRQVEYFKHHKGSLKTAISDTDTPETVRKLWDEDKPHFGGGMPHRYDDKDENGMFRCKYCYRPYSHDKNNPVKPEEIEELRKVMGSLKEANSMDTKCESCGKELGPEVFLSKWPVCGDCTRKRHKEVTNPSGKPKKKAEGEKIPLTVFGGGFYAIETSGNNVEAPHGYAIFDPKGTQVMVITTEAPISQERLESIVHDEYGKRELVRATLIEDAEGIKAGSKLVVSGINRKSKKIQVISDEKRIWIDMTKVAVSVENLEQHIDQMKTKMTQTQERLDQAVNTKQSETLNTAEVSKEADEPMPTTILPSGMKWMWDADTRKWVPSYSTQFH